MEVNLHDFEFGNNFLAQKVQKIKQKIDKLDFINIKNFCAKNIINKVKR